MQLLSQRRRQRPFTGVILCPSPPSSCVCSPGEVSVLPRLRLAGHWRRVTSVPQSAPRSRTWLQGRVRKWGFQVQPGTIRGLRQSWRKPHPGGVQTSALLARTPGGVSEDETEPGRPTVGGWTATARSCREQMSAASLTRGSVGGVAEVPRRVVGGGHHIFLQFERTGTDTGPVNSCWGERLLLMSALPCCR